MQVTQLLRRVGCVSSRFYNSSFSAVTSRRCAMAIRVSATTATLNLHERAFSSVSTAGSTRGPKEPKRAKPINISTQLPKKTTENITDFGYVYKYMSFFQYSPSLSAQANTDLAHVRMALLSVLDACGVLGRVYLSDEGINSQIICPVSQLETFEQQMRTFASVFCSRVFVLSCVCSLCMCLDSAFAHTKFFVGNTFDKRTAVLPFSRCVVLVTCILIWLCFRFCCV